METILENMLGIIIADAGVQAACQTGATIQRMIKGKNYTAMIHAC